MSVVYLEPDDEITGAIARVRAVTDGEVVVVVPHGSRIATSRINFKLLGKEANERRLNIVAVSDEPQVRALAISAGMPTYDSLPAAEQALAKFRDADRRLAERTGRGPDEPPPPPRPPDPQRSSDVPAETMAFTGALRDAPEVAGIRGQRPTGAAAEPLSETAVLTGAATGASTGAVGSARRRTKAKRRIGIAPILVIALLALLVSGVAYGAYMFLPTATITLVPATSQLNSEPFTITADPGVAVADVEAGVVPAQRIDVPVHVSGSFPSSGLEARETRAEGVVRFRSENTLNDVAIPSDTVVSTADGVEFVTQQSVTVPRASFQSGPTTVEVGVRAVRPGPRGNVPADTITDLPASLAAQLITVRNPQPTDGGRRIEENIVTREDYDAAVASLTEQLGAKLASTVADPASVPRGLTAFPTTATVGNGTPDQPANALVGTITPTFSLGLDANGSVVAVNEALVDDLAAQRVRAELANDQRIVGDDVASGRSAGSVAGDSIEYQVSPTATVFSAPNDAALIDLVRGKSLSEALAALARYGEVDIDVWPDFVDRIPDQAARIRVNVAPPGGGS